MRLLVAPVLLAAGAATGLATVALHERWWGLLLGAAATALTLGALPPGWCTRTAFALGWTVLLGLLASPRPEGDYAVGTDLPGYLLLGLGVAVLLTALLSLPGSGSVSGARLGSRLGSRLGDDRRVGP